MITGRYSKANNKYMKNYNKKLKSKFIKYLDTNNLYGLAMSKKMPYSNFEWVSQDVVDKMNDNIKKSKSFKKIPPSILEVDLEYPKELHDDHNDYPLAPERRKNKQS